MYEKKMNDQKILFIYGHTHIIEILDAENNINIIEPTHILCVDHNIKRVYSVGT